MKPIKTYILCLLLLISLTLVFDHWLISIYEIRIGFVFRLIRTYVLTDALGCLSLLFFYLPFTYHSSLKIILISSLCFVLVSFLGFIGSYVTVWKSNIPEEIMLFQERGLHLNMAHSLAAFISSAVTATTLILTKSKNR